MNSNYYSVSLSLLCFTMMIETSKRRNALILYFYGLEKTIQKKCYQHRYIGTRLHSHCSCKKGATSVVRFSKRAKSPFDIKI